MEPEIPKVYSPEAIEPRWARAWIEQKLYRPADDDVPGRPNFCLTIPPPNITGVLHMGHMLEHTEIDILMRWHRMRGENVLWLPGTDHAAIATQMIVERELGREALAQRSGPAGEAEQAEESQQAQQGNPQAKAAWQREGQRVRLAMGRKAFIERCWKWKEENGGTIRRQMERLGASVDWTRDRFTMDEAYTRAVVEVFVRLYEKGMIYRGQYIVNWCPDCGTAVSDLEVIHEDRPGHLWYIRYPFADGSGYVTVATTRPETMLGDTAVAVNPADERYRDAVGRNVVVPLVDRVVPVIADDFVDPKFGTGAVKVTPAHDPNDYAIAERHRLPRVTVIDEHARMTGDAGEAYQGLDRFKAREKVVHDLTQRELLEKTENYALSVGTCQRSKTVIEPLLSTQWFLKMKPLAEPAIRVVEEGRVRIVPENYKKIYLDWMGRIYDWCISRQLWWGHRIPAWTCDACGEIIVARQTPSGCPKCGNAAGASLRPETDTLDTWFSSGLWPFATLGWPEETPDLKRFYPNDLMIMGFDILFFWGARMIMLGLEFMHEVPFRELYIHALVRDAERQKMSKTKGNVLDPLEVTEKYGTDAVRFALAISAAPGTDIAFSVEKVEAYRAFANKIWNAGRFILMNLHKLPEPMKDQLAAGLEPAASLGFDAVAAPERLALADRWIFSRLLTVTREMNDALANFRFHEAAYTIYHFFWHEFCDWYVEWVKPEITKATEDSALSAGQHDKAPTAWLNLTRVFEAALHLLHPFMPFITEELWHQLPHAERKPSISLQSFSLVSDRVSDPVAEREFQNLQELTVAARNAKAEMGLQTQRPSAQVACEKPHDLELFRAHQETILRLAGLEALNFTSERPAAGTPDLRHVSASTDLRLFHETKIDAHTERQRLEREKEKIEKALASAKAQIENQAFISRAPRDVVRGVEHRHAELSEQYRKVIEALRRLGSRE
ncbi:MAG: valine--tRNA ligase [Terriglobales bacterium]